MMGMGQSVPEGLGLMQHSGFTFGRLSKSSPTAEAPEIKAITLWAKHEHTWNGRLFICIDSKGSRFKLDYFGDRWGLLYMCWLQLFRSVKYKFDSWAIEWCKKKSHGKGWFFTKHFWFYFVYRHSMRFLHASDLSQPSVCITQKTF